MFGSTILEVAIGLILVYLLLSLICSALQESLEAWLKVRATSLERGLRELLHDPDGSGLTTALYNHPLIYGLFRGNYDPVRVRSRTQTTNLPSYIPAEHFATALIDTVVRGPVPVAPASEPPVAGEITFESVRAALAGSRTLNPAVQRALLLALDSAQGDLAQARTNIEDWFNHAMDRVSGWYKRRMHVVILTLGLFLSIVLNIDSLKIANTLYHNETLRTVIVAEAESVAGNSAPPSGDVKTLQQQLSLLQLPIGWRAENNEAASGWPAQLWATFPASLPGWLITAFAISFGAPFWFDLLGRLIVLRTTLKPVVKKADEPAPASPPAQSLPTVAFAATGLPLVAAPAPETFHPHAWADATDRQGGVL